MPVDRGLPAALDYPVGVQVACPPVGVPHAAGVLQPDLRVRAERLEADGSRLWCRQLDTSQADLPDLGERQGDDHVIRVHVMVSVAAGEGAGVPAVAALADGHQPFR